MELHEFSRSALLLGDDGIERLKKSGVIVFGVGGVGSYAVEALARSGIGSITIFDHDTVSLTNINRQLIATHETIGKPKVEIVKERIRTINPAAQVTVYQEFYTEDNADQFPLAEYDYIIDAIDTLSAKLLLAQRAQAVGTPTISCMGTGNKLDPTQFTVADITKTSVCPLAKVMRRELKKRGVNHLKVVFSREQPLKVAADRVVETKGSAGRPAPGSISFVPPVAGMILAGEVIRTLSGIE